MNFKITIKELNVFQTIIKHKTVQQAAYVLNITQSAASQALLKLENSLNCSLFDRNGKQLVLNENGRLLLPLAINTLSSIENIESLFLAHPISVKIGASTTIGNYIMPTKLALFHHQYPLAKLVMKIDNTKAIITAVANFDVDIGLIEGSCLDKDIVVTPWLNDDLVMFKAFTPRNKIMTHQELLALNWLLREKGSGTREIVEQFLQSQLGDININMELGNSEAIKHAVAAGSGVSCLSHYVVSDLLDQHKISLIKSTLPKLSRKLYILTHRNKIYTQGMNTFLTLLKIEC